MIDRSLKAKVTEILYWCPYTRNSDINLWVEIVKRFYWNEWLCFLHNIQGDRFDPETKINVPLKTFMHDVPNQDGVKRWRAWYNSPDRKNPKYLPTNRLVARARQFNMKWWHEQLGVEGLSPDQHLEQYRQKQHIKSIRKEGASIPKWNDKLFNIPSQSVH